MGGSALLPVPSDGVLLSCDSHLVYLMLWILRLFRDSESHSFPSDPPLTRLLSSSLPKLFFSSRLPIVDSECVAGRVNL